MIQEPINRMSTTSAIFKGFAATIVSGVAALAFKEINTWVLALSFLPVLVFAMLDIYYLKLERRFKYLYDQVRLGKTKVDFSMHIQLNKTEKRAARTRVWDCIKSPSIWLFYPVMVFVLTTVLIFKITEVI